MTRYRWLRFYGGLQFFLGVVVLLVGGGLTLLALADTESGAEAAVVLAVGIPATLLAALTPMAIGEAISALLRIVELVEDLDADAADADLPDHAPPFCPDCNGVLGTHDRECPHCGVAVSVADAIVQRRPPPPA